MSTLWKTYEVTFPNYLDIKHTYDMDSDYYYDTKNCKYLTESQYLSAKSRYKQETKELEEKRYLRTRAFIDYLEKSNELDRIKLLKCYRILLDEELSSKYTDYGLSIIRIFYCITKIICYNK